ncbi:prolyl oligopeptidase family serine peptidase [Massilia sp. BJB1822]|nr:CocE/NonD family hydrolase [Massilia sp. BJB1822]NVD99400.1 prolyl oligopeptidase family serine peptidase [Massilia sp. BJB1822]
MRRLVSPLTPARRLAGVLLALACGLLVDGAVAATAAGLAPSLAPLDARLNEQILMLPAGPGGRERLETTLFKPDGPGPFPLLVINHGKAPGNPRLQRRDRFVYMATAFVRRGYAVLVPMRTGFANSSGRYSDFGCNMTANGYAQAADIADVLEYAGQQSWIDARRIVVAGQSYGGLASMALATQDIPGVRGVLNFAGGLRTIGGSCDWQQALVQAFADYGRRSRLPSLWLYGANDSFFAPPLVSRLHQAYTRGGGKAQLLAYGAFKSDAHRMLASRDGEKIWLPHAERFLQAIGMPFREVYALAETPAAPASSYAALEDVAALPYVPERGREQYRAFLKRMTPRAFAISASGAWGWAEEGEEPEARALAACQSSSEQPCRLYSVDERVVWPAVSAGRTD